MTAHTRLTDPVIQLAPEPVWMPSASIAPTSPSRSTSSMVGPGPAPLASPLNILHLFKCLRRNWSKALSVAFFAAVLVGGMIFLFLPAAKPYATTKLYYPPKAAALGGQNEPLLNQRTQKELILSRSVLKEAAERADVASLESIQERGDGSVYWLSRELQIDFPPESEILKLTLNGDRMEDLKPIVDAVRDVYIAQFVDRSSRSRRDTHEKLKDALKLGEERLKSTQDDYQKVTEKIGGSDAAVIALQQKYAQEAQEKVRDLLEKVRYDLKNVRVLEAILVAKEPKPLPGATATPTEVRDADPEEYAELLKEKKGLETLYFRAKQVLAPEHQDLVIYRERIAELSRRMGQFRLPAPVNGNPTSAIRIQTSADARERIQELENDEKLLGERLAGKTAEVTQLRDASIASEKARSKLRDAEKNYTNISESLDKMQFDVGANRVQIMEETVTIRPNDAARRLKMTVLGGGGTFALVILTFAFLEFRLGRLDSPEQIREMGIPLFGTLPQKPKKKPDGQNEETDSQWEQIVTESVDSIRATLLHRAEVRGLNVVMVTSATAGEGKSSVSFRLARSIARTGKRTLLIDGDLRAPMLHTLFQKALSPGLSDYLRAPTDLVHNLQTTGHKDLWLMSAGACDGQVIDRLAQGGFADLLDVLRTMFDFILIDSSPILPVADGLIMARQCDGVVMSVLCDVTRIERVTSARHRLASVGIQPLGAVVSGTREEAYGIAIESADGKALPSLVDIGG